MGKITAFMLLLISLLQTSCRKEQIEITPAGTYFQYYYSNFAWGGQRNGFTITPAGEIYFIDMTTPWEYGKDGIIPLDSIRRNLKVSNKVDTLIIKSELDHYQGYASTAVTGTLSNQVNRGADMGTLLYRVFIPDKTNHSNHTVYILSETGDFERQNSTPEAKKIVDWLNKIREELFR